MAIAPKSNSKKFVVLFKCCLVWSWSNNPLGFEHYVLKVNEDENLLVYPTGSLAIRDTTGMLELCL
jgi:hypothetical protein